MVNGQATTYAYDLENRLITANTPTAVLGYSYNPDGIRVSSEIDGQVTTYLVDENRAYAEVVEERDAASLVTAFYRHADDLISQEHDGEVLVNHQDGHGSITALTNSQETVTDSYTYDGWGNILASTGSTPNPYRYTGEAFDVSLGMYYLRARYYQPTQGRFHTMDSWKGNILIVTTLNKYLYANASPSIFKDPSGKFTLIELNQNFVAASTLSFLTLITLSNHRIRASIIISATLLINQIEHFIHWLILMSTHDKALIDGLLEPAADHADKIANFSPNGSKDPRGHWRKEIKAALQRALRLAKKRLKGKTRDATIEKILSIAKKAGVQLTP